MLHWPCTHVSSWTGWFALAASLATCLLSPLPLCADDLSAEDLARPFRPEGRDLAGLVIVLDAAPGDRRGVPSGDDLNLLVVGHLQHHLRAAGATVRLTRWEAQPGDAAAADAGASGSRSQRPADHAPADLVVSVDHPNRAGDADFGVVVRTATGAGGLDDAMLATIAKRIGATLDARLPHTRAHEVRTNDAERVGPPGTSTMRVEVGNLAIEEFGAWAATRGRHRDIAMALYAALTDALPGHRDAFNAVRAKRGLGAGSAATTQPAPTDGQEPDPAARVPGRLRQAVAELWRSDGPPERPSDAQWLLDQYFRRVLTDRTFFHARVTVECEGETWVVRGATNFDRLRHAATLVLQQAGCRDVRNEVMLLPNERLGSNCFGVIREPTAMSWAEPRTGAGVQTQLLLGEPVFLLDESPGGGYLLVHGADGYVGWVRSEVLTRLDASAFTTWLNTPIRVLKDEFVLGGLRLPAGAALPLADGPEATGETVRLRLPPGTPGAGEQHVVSVPARHLAESSAGRAGLQAARVALGFLTTPYVFGGRSRLGLDCSGLTGISYATCGVVLPRDARQQVLVGRLVATSWAREGLLPGDLLFFCDESGSVIHTGVSLGAGRFVHAAPPEVHISSLDPNDSVYDDTWARAFAFARRPMP